MSYLAAIGRAQPVQAIQTFQANQQSAALRDQQQLMNTKQMAVQDLQMKKVEQDMEIQQRQSQQEIEREQARKSPQAVEPFMDMFEGGAESPMAQMVHEYAVNKGYVDLSRGGAGTITMELGEKLMEDIQQPTFAAKISRTRIDYWRQQRGQIKEQLQQKPDDPKLQAALEQATTGLNQAIGQDEALINEMKNRPAEDGGAPFTLGQGQTRYDSEGNVIAAAPQTDGKPKDMQSYMLPDQSFVNSFDGGMTYTMPGGERVQMPQGSIKVSATLTGTELQALKAQAMARNESGGVIPTPAKTPEEMDRAAESATGIGANLRALVDNVLGGVGIASMVGKDGFFQDTQENRQTLNLIKQMGKMALMNSSRGPVYEQQIIENLFPNPGRFFVNPKTEAKKFQTIRSIMVQEKMFNNMAMQNMTDPAAIQRLVENNKEIDSLLYHLGGTDARPGDEIIQVFGDTIEDQLSMAESLPEGTVFIDGNGVKRVKQGDMQ